MAPDGAHRRLAAILSADAVPEIVDAIPDTRSNDRLGLMSMLSQIRTETDERPLRSWTWGHYRARKALDENTPN